jgi:hypothetical protein
MDKVRIIIEFEQTQPDGSVETVQRIEEREIEDKSILEGIDSCEKVVLQTAYAAMRGAVSDQMSAVSKKNRRNRQFQKLPSKR